MIPQLYLFIAGGLLFSFYEWISELIDRLLFPPNNAPNPRIGFQDPNVLFCVILCNGLAFPFMEHASGCMAWSRMSLTRFAAMMGTLFTLSGTVALAREAFFFCRLKSWQYMVICLWLAGIDLCQPFHGSVCLDNFSNPYINLHLFG